MTRTRRPRFAARARPRRSPARRAPPTPVPPVPPRRGVASEWPSYGGDPGGSRFARAARDHPRERRAASRSPGPIHTRDVEGAEGKRSTGRLREHADPRRRHAVPLHAAQPRDRPRPGDRRGALALRPRDRRSTGATPTRSSAAASPPGSTRRRAEGAAVPAAHPHRAPTTRGSSPLDAATGRPCARLRRGAAQIDLNPAAGAAALARRVPGDLAAGGDRRPRRGRLRGRRQPALERAERRGARLRRARRGAALGLRPRAAGPARARRENTSAAGYVLGTPNAWAPFAVDEARDLLFVPTGQPHARLLARRQPARWTTTAARVLALRGRTGELVWHFQTVHHDVWDYDVPAQPLLTTVRRDGRDAPRRRAGDEDGHAVRAAPRDGRAALPRRGARRCPSGGVPDERLAPTQPFPTRPPPLVPHAVSPDDAWGVLGVDRWLCRRRIEARRARPHLHAADDPGHRRPARATPGGSQLGRHRRRTRSATSWSRT